VVIILIFIRHHGGTIPLTDTMNTIVSGALSLIPEGLLLASTILLSYGAVKLASQGVLIQHLPAIEGFSRLRYLCLDKTGTLTQSATVLQSIEPFSGYRLGVIYEYLQGFAYGDPAPNSTIRAIAAALPSAEQHVVDRVPFSSDKKWSAICLKEGNRYRWLSLGAPEHLAAHCQNEVAILRNAQEKMALGIRVLLLVDYGLQSETAFPHQEKGQPSAFLLFSQQLRPNVIDALFYVQAQGVSVKVISGDSVSTVKAIAKKVGIRQSDVCITGEELAMLDELTWYEKVPQYTIFARIVPEQKEKIIRTLTKYGFTGMVGDGVNDALALKNANLSVAMAEGSPASRKVADVVLLTNNFSVFPAGMRLGNQIILSLEMITCLFIHRIVFSSVLLLLALILGSSYPFQSRHLLLLNVFVVGIPTFLWSVFPQETGHRAENKGFFQRILRYALPQGLITGLAITVGYALATLLYSSGNDTTAPRLVATMIAFALSMLTFWTIPLSLNAIQSRSLQILQGWYFTVSPLLFFALFQFEWVRNYFGFTTISIPQWITIIVVVIAAGYGQIHLVRRQRKRVY
jgi:cation-transporting ATPase E